MEVRPQCVPESARLAQKCFRVSVYFTTMNKGQDYRNTQKQRSEEAQKETIRLIDIGLTQSINKYLFSRPELSVY